jgi:alpha-amylase/alpha-mannosidase (GH57 family)
VNTHCYLCVYGHFYQPPRYDPFTGQIPHEYGAEPYPNFNEKITAECYRPNAVADNFAAISFDIGPTLAVWLEQAHPDVAARIIAADQVHAARYGVGNALAQPYIHSILPLATLRDRRTLIRWGLADFAHHYRHPAEGMWLPETAVDLATLDVLAEQRIRYTVLAPWQATAPVDPTEPYIVRLPSGRSITVFFYQDGLSGGVAFDDALTSNADRFAAENLARAVNGEKAAHARDQLILLASDGEHYGHHKPWRDQFLRHLLRSAAQDQGFTVTTLGRYLLDHSAMREVVLRDPSSWSCSHGVARRSTGCTCTTGDASWKPALRRSFDRLAARLDACYEQQTENTLRDPWEARDDALGVIVGD